MRVLEAAALAWLTVQVIGAALAVDNTGLDCLKRKTLDALGMLAHAGLAEKSPVAPTDGMACHPDHAGARN